MELPKRSGKKGQQQAAAAAAVAGAAGAKGQQQKGQKGLRGATPAKQAAAAAASGDGDIDADGDAAMGSAGAGAGAGDGSNPWANIGAENPRKAQRQGVKVAGAGDDVQLDVSNPLLIDSNADSGEIESTGSPVAVLIRCMLTQSLICWAATTSRRRSWSSRPSLRAPTSKT